MPRLVAHLLLHLRLFLLVDQEGQRLRVLLLQTIHNHQKALKNGIEPPVEIPFPCKGNPEPLAQILLRKFLSLKYDFSCQRYEFLY